MRAIPDLIARRKSAIVDRWVEGARRAASARGLNRPKLINLIPAYVSTLGHAPSEAPAPEQQQLIETHLSGRLRQGFELSEALLEFSLLARAVGDELAALPPSAQPPAEEVAQLFEELYIATTLVTKIYSGHLMEDEQLEKRYARLIQDVVSEAIQAGDGDLPIRAQMTGVLDLVREALGADAAALLLYDAKSERLVSTASTGLAGGSLEEYIAEVSPQSFVGKVATEPHAVFVRDTDTTPLGLSDSLRSSGIRSLLGVRLSAAEGLVGVLFVGSKRQRTFTPSEVRRLESLGDRLTLHIENAQLSARLREKLGQLQLFVDVLAHDLRGPLTTALLSAAALRDGPSDQATMIDRVERSLRRADRMLTGLLDAHRVAAGELLPIHSTEADLDSLLSDVADEADAPERRRVHVRATGRMRGIFDPELVRRAVWNLIANALSYGDPGAPVTLTAQGSDDGFVIEVHNEGSPIPQPDQAQLFKPFTRVGTAANDVPRGWGLGLALVAGCAAAHGGSVSVRSEPGEGTTFRLAIPWQQATQASAAPTVQ